jgi:hypothetical protein
MFWFEGSELIGDIAGTGKSTTLPLVQSKIVEFFEHHDYFACYQDVVFVQNPFRSKISKYPMVPFPYSGPDFRRVIRNMEFT